MFWSVLWYFSLFLENRLVSYENMHIYSWQYSDGIALCLVLILRGFFGGVGMAYFQHFSLFLEKRLVCFMKFCKGILGITQAITQKIIRHVVFIFQGYVRSHFCTLYRSPCHEKRQIFPWCFAQIFWSLRKKE